MNSTPISLAVTVMTLFALSGCAATGGADSKANAAPDKVVYHVNDTGAQAVAALRNVGNHLEVNPKAHIVVVTHAQGVDFLMDGAKDRNGNPYNIRVEELRAQGVKFDVCDHAAQPQPEKEPVHLRSDLRSLGGGRDHAAAAARGLCLSTVLGG